MKNAYLTMAAVLALVTAAALTPMAVQQQVFASTEIDGAQSETETEVEAKNKCNNSGFSTCNQAATSSLNVGRPTAPLPPEP
jgi:hypothetical protein